MSAAAGSTSLVERGPSASAAFLPADPDEEGDNGHCRRRWNRSSTETAPSSENEDEAAPAPVPIVAGDGNGRDEGENGEKAAHGPGAGAARHEAVSTPPQPEPQPSPALIFSDATPPRHLGDGDEEEGGGAPPSPSGAERQRRAAAASSPLMQTMSSCYSNVAPPGPEAMTAWLTRDHHRAGEDSSPDEEATPRRDDYDYYDDDDNAAVRRFVGPPDVGPAGELRRRRLEHVALGGGGGGAKRGEPLETVSYKLLDTPVWHNRAASIEAGRRDDGTGAVGDEQRLATLLRRVFHCRMGPLFASGGPGCRRPRAKGGGGPIRDYQQNERFVARIVLFCVGFSMSVVGFAVEWLADRLLTSKLDWAIGLAGSSADSFSAASGFGPFIGMNLLFAFLAFLPVAVRPAAAGSGIAEAKAILNGIILPRATELKTALCKGIGVVFSYAASLPVGLEGPLIFLGLCLGENSQRFLPNSYAPLKSDRSRRDFAAVGAASGVAAAFLAPVGGVLFAMEEGSSFWSVVLAWRSFGAACVVVIFLYVWMAAADGGGGAIDVATFSKYDGLPGRRMMNFLVTFRMYDYFAFALMGAAGGVAGACFVEANRAISVLRGRGGRWASGLPRKCGEVLLLTAATSALLWWLPRAYVVCGRVPFGPMTADDGGEFFRQFGCPDGQYNHLATLLLNPAGSIGLNMLFWEPEGAFTAATCLIAGTIYLLVLLLLFGTSISMGIFIPLLYIGACYGRALGVALGLGDVTRTYAMVGAVSMLAGVARVLISLTVIMVTTTGLPYMVTPFMVATLCAKASGKAAFGRDGIYDVILQTKKIPFLEAEPPQAVWYRGLRAEDVMSTSLVVLEPEQNVGGLLRYLKEYNFADFPVTDPSRGGAFLGIVTRSDILVLLSHAGLLYSPQADGAGSPPRRALRYDLLLHKHQGGPTLESVEEALSEDDLEKVIDLTPYLEIAHYTFNMLGSVERAFELFRTLGLRTLIVTGGPQGRPVGVITRYDLRLLEELDMDEARLRRSREAAVEYNAAS